MPTSSALISIRVPIKIAKRLEILSKSIERSKSYIAAEAIEDYLDLHEWQIKAIQEGLQEIEQDQVIDFLKVKKNLGLLD